MIARIDALLCRWGRWAVAHARREVGYPTVSPMFKDMGSGAYGCGIPAGVDDQMAAVDCAVSSLPSVHRSVVVTHYQFSVSKRETAVKCGIGRSMCDRFLRESHVRIDRWLTTSQNRP